MITSQKMHSAMRTSTDPVTIADISYARESLRNAVYDYVLRRFMQEAKPNNVNRAHIARVLQKKPEQITRWLGAPGNWTLDTVSDLLLAMGFDPVDIVAPDQAKLRSNYAHELATGWAELAKLTVQPTNHALIARNASKYAQRQAVARATGRDSMASAFGGSVLDRIKTEGRGKKTYRSAAQSSGIGRHQ